MSIPFELRQSLENGSAILFVGAGMGYNMIDEKGDRIPDGIGLAQRIADHFKVPVGSDYNLAKISQYVVGIKKGRTELTAFLCDCFSNAFPDEFMSWIPTIRWKAIFTTNYDDTIQKAYKNCKSPAQDCITITHIAGFKDFLSPMQVPIIHLHGALFAESSPEILITQQDYIKYKQKRKSLFEFLKHQMVSSCILYTGYSHNDSNWNMIIDDIEEELYPNKPAKAFRIDPYSTEMDMFNLGERNIETIQQYFSDFVNAARIELDIKYSPSMALSDYQKSIPDDYQEAYTNDPIPTLRLLSSWEYVNSITGHGITHSVHDYLRGDRPNWGLIINNEYFHRDIEDEIYENLLDFITESRRRINVCIIKGSAGYGVSTLMMAIAMRLVTDRAGRVFYHRITKEIREGDVFYACSADIEKHIFFIDNAADYSSEIRSLIHHARDGKYDAIFILGDRINELNQMSHRISGETFIIQPLSNSEIEKLIDFLTIHNELNKLEHLDQDHRVAAIRKNYNRELLVAIREATEGRDFDAIIEDEFFGIKDDFSRQAYLIICCFHQHGALLRIELIAQLMGISISEFYARIRIYLEGIIFYETINEFKGEYAARTRHRLISTIVWNRCIAPSEKEAIVHSVLDNMNIAYPIDKAAFESFIRSDQLVDSLVSIESRISFFEKACRMDPDNPFVRQHYARMLVRAKIETSALDIIDKAIEINGSIRILYHTKGYVLSNMALKLESIELARRRLGQSEMAYRHALNMNDKDEYCYQGLAQLYLGWAKRCTEEQEQALYLAKAEEIVQEGLIKVRDKEGIWIESANIDRFIGDTPSSIKALKRAVEAAPGSVLSRYLLARAYNISGQFDKSIPILKELTQEFPDQYKPSIEYASVIVKTGGDIDNAIAILQQSTIYGFSDPRFIATYGGLLFLTKDFSKSERIFSESQRREFSNSRIVLFYPKDFGIDSSFDAKVNYVGTGYSWISIAGFPDIICPASKYNGLVLKHGMMINVTINFSPMRPVAYIN